MFQYDNLPPPFEGSTCIDIGGKDENPLTHFKHYSYAACKSECLIKYAINTCGCIAFNMNSKW